jgi:crotonobetainyl-CoA:carnitine CoA-transferase CaiB-like acyl-CoA transferase
MLDGVKVVEASMWVMAPAAAAVLADWGASVIRIEHPRRPDPLRALLPGMGFDATYDFNIEQHNHSKRSVAADLSTPGGRDVLIKLIADADVFVTSFLEPTRRKWKITHEDLKAHNPQLIYARTHGWGPKGDEAYMPGYDSIAYWARSGLGVTTAKAGQRARSMPTGGIGDSQSGAMLAGGIAAALYRRAVSGEAAVVDVSLLGMGVWAMWETLLAVGVYGVDPKVNWRSDDPVSEFNPLSGAYFTRDKRDVSLAMLEPDRFWHQFCVAFELEHLEHDERFNSFEARAKNRDELVGIISEFTGSHDYRDLCDRLRRNGCAYGAYATPAEVLEDPQVIANGYLVPHATVEGKYVISSPVQFNERPVTMDSAAAELGQHTEEVLLELGYSWDEILELKEAGDIL